MTQKAGVSYIVPAPPSALCLPALLSPGQAGKLSHLSDHFAKVAAGKSHEEFSKLFNHYGVDSPKLASIRKINSL